MRFLVWMLIGIGYSWVGMAADTTRSRYAVIAYYSGNATDIDRYNVRSLTHLIYSFALLKNNRLHVSAAAGQILKKLVSVKKKNPSLKVALAFGGWGGCPTCSHVFALPENRTAFAKSVLAILQQYQLDGIDIDWEFPAIEGLPGHAYAPADKQTFTELIKAVREALGKRYEISFAAGVFPDYLYRSVAWEQVMPLVDRVHLMTYDMVNRNSAFTGHHAALYSTSFQSISIDNTIRFLDSLHFMHVLTGLPIPVIRVCTGRRYLMALRCTKVISGFLLQAMDLRGIGMIRRKCLIVLIVQQSSLQLLTMNVPWH